MKGNTDIVYISYGNGASSRLDKQSQQDAPGSLQVRQENTNNKVYVTESFLSRQSKQKYFCFQKSPYQVDNHVNC